jgi:hypothetical protein
MRILIHQAYLSDPQNSPLAFLIIPSIDQF